MSKIENTTMDNDICRTLNFTNTTANSSQAVIGSSYQMIRQVHMVLYMDILPFIVIIGLIGNLLSIYLLLSDKQMRNLSSSIYLLAVLSSDTGTLTSLVLVWLEALGYPLNHLPAVCRISVYLTYVCGFLSIWYVVCITVETFITVCHPTKIQQMCTLFRARIVAIVLLLTALIIYIVSPVITEVQPIYYAVMNRTVEQCVTLPRFDQLALVVSYTDTVLTLIVPFILLIVLLTLITMAIVRSIQKKKKRSIKITTGNGVPTSSSSSKLPQVRVAKMLFILSVSVVVLNAPSHVIRLWSMFMSVSVLPEIEGLVHLIFLFVSYSSFSVKFFIMIACSKNFRKLLTTKVCSNTRTIGRYHSVHQQTIETTA